MDVLLTDTPEKLHPIKFDAIDPDLAKNTVKTRGRAGLSGLDAKKMEKNLDNKTVQQRLHWFIYSYCKIHHETMHNRYSFPIARSSFCMSFNSFG